MPVDNLAGKNYAESLGPNLMRRVITDGRDGLIAPNSAVVLIDMQGDDVPQDWRMLVREQKSLLRIARNHDLPIFIARRVSAAHQPQTIPALSEEAGKSDVVMDFTRSPGNALEGINAATGAGLRESLLARFIGTVFVIGQDTNACVASTIFGQTLGGMPGPNGPEPTRYLPGLLDVGISVVTSLALLHPKRFEGAYTFLDIGKRTNIREDTRVGNRRPMPEAMAAAMEAEIGAPLDAPTDAHV